MSESTKGQQNRKQIRQQIEATFEKYCPNTLEKLADYIAYEFNLSPYTVRYTYLPMFITVGILEFNDEGMVDLSAKGKNLQTSVDGLIDEEIKEEHEEENENRKQLGKPEVTLEEWKKTRPKRIKPLGD